MELIKMGRADKNVCFAKLEEECGKWVVRHFLFVEKCPDWSDYFQYLDDVVEGDVEIFDTKTEAQRNLARKQVMLNI